MLEQLALGRVREAVELEGVLPDMEVRLERDLLDAVCAAQRGRRCRNEVADAAHIEHEAVRTAGDRLAPESGDHALTFSRGGASAWQIATASASEACVELGGSVSLRIV